MITLAKSIPLGALLALIISLFVGSGGGTGGTLGIELYTIEGYSFYWSWRIFLLGTALSFAIVWMMSD